jgi:TolB protein
MQNSQVIRLSLFTFCALALLLLAPVNSLAQNNGVFTSIQDIGNPKHKGSTKFDLKQQTYTLTGSGVNMWGNRDEVHFVAVKISGDFILTTFCRFESKGVNLHRKMGLMIRENSDPGSRYADVAIHGDGLTSLQYRMKENELTAEVKAAMASPDVIQLERKGDTVVMRCARNGEPLAETGRISITFKAPVYAGLFVCSHDPEVIEKALFYNFRIDVPAGEALDGYQHPSASRLEILDVNTAMRKVIYSTQGHIEAPNWSADGKFLIYNSGGLLYKFP